MAEQKTEAIKYWKMTADGLGDIGMFNSCSLPSMSLQASEFKVWDGQGKPNPLPTGVQATFGDVTLGRGVDDKAELWKWISKIAQKGATADTVKEVTLMACNADGGAGPGVEAHERVPVVVLGRGHGGRGHGRADRADLDQVHGRAARRRGRPDRRASRPGGGGGR